MIVVTIAINPKSCGTSNRASIMTYARFRKNFVPCAAVVMSPLEIVRCLRFGSRWPVAKCCSEVLAAGEGPERTARAAPPFAALERSIVMLLRCS